MKEKKPINVEIGQNIKLLRESAGMTQENFAELVNLGVKHISAIECGAVGISLSTMKRMCAVLSVSADALLFGARDAGETGERTADAALLSSRLSRLSDREFYAVKDVLDRVLEAMAIAKDELKGLEQEIQ